MAVQKPNWLLRFINPKSGHLDSHAMRTLTDMATQTNTNTDDVATNTAAIAALPFQKSFTSTQQTYSNGGSVTVAHGLGTTPLLVQIRAVCQIANDSYSPPDEVVVSENFIAPLVDGTNIELSISSGGIFIVPKGGGVSAAITVADWKLVVRAWV